MPPIAVPLLPADGQWKGNGAIFPSSRTERPSRKEIGEIGENRLFPPVPVSKEHPAETIRLRSRKRGKEMTSTGHPANSHGKRTTAKSKRKWREQTGAAIPLRSPGEKDHPFFSFQRSFFGDHGGILRAAGGHAEEMPSGAIFPNLFRRQTLRSISRGSVPSRATQERKQSRGRRSFRPPARCGENTEMMEIFLSFSPFPVGFFRFYFITNAWNIRHLEISHSPSTEKEEKSY